MTAMPDFLILGAMKAGTSSLYQYLAQHPQIFMSSDKEPQFFALGEMDPPPAIMSPIPSRIAANWQQYLRQYDRWRGQPAIGEASTSSLHIERAARRIRERLPEAKLIAVLRHPADRAYSNWLFLRKLCVDPIADFQQALDAEASRDIYASRTFQYRMKGLYHQHLSRYYALFPASRIRVYLYEDLRDNPLEMIRDICRFLGVDDAFTPDMSIRYNVSGEPRNGLVGSCLKAARPVRRWIERHAPARLLGTVRDAMLKRPGLDPDLRRQLMDECRCDILQLQDLIQRDLTHWFN